MIVAVLLTFSLSVALFRVLPISSQGPGDYDPWYDINDDGKIDMRDIGGVCRKFGTLGTPITKVALEYDSGWIDISDKAGTSVDIVHNLGTTNIMVDIVGSAIGPGADPHQRNLGGSGYSPGWKIEGGFPSTEIARAIIQTSDGGYAVAGSTDLYGYSDVMLEKYDWLGRFEWREICQRDLSWDYARGLVQASDGGYVIAGYELGDGTDAMLVKIDSDGNEEWHKAYEPWPGEYTYFESIARDALADRYVMVGYTYAPTGDDQPLFIMTVDASGNTIDYARHVPHVVGDHILMSVDNAWDPAGGYVAAGGTQWGGGVSNFYICIWNRDLTAVLDDAAFGYSGDYFDFAFSVIRTSDGGYALTGATESFGAGGYDAWLVKVDSELSVQWTETYGGSYKDLAYSMIQTSDGGYALLGLTKSYGQGPTGYSDMWLVKTDSDGNMEWMRTFGRESHDEAGYELVKSIYGGYAMAGYTAWGAGLYNFYIVKTESMTYGLTWTHSTADSITLFRGTYDIDWEWVKVRIWEIQTP